MAEACSQGNNTSRTQLQEKHAVLMIRDPYCLYAYWSIPSDVRKQYTEKFGNIFWSDSKSAVKVINVTENSSYIANINENTFSRYIDVDKSNCIYAIEIGRHFQDGLFVGIASSNYVSLPADFEAPVVTPCFEDYKAIREGKVNASLILDQANINSVGNQHEINNPYRIKPAMTSNLGLSSHVPALRKKG